MKYIQIFHVDKLELTFYKNEIITKLEDVSIGSTIDINSYLFVRTNPKSYKYNFMVHSANAFIGYLFWETYNPNRVDCYLSVDNKLLYTNINLVYDFIGRIELEFKQISKLDICMDTNKNIVNHIQRIIKHTDISLVLNNKKVYRDKIIDEIVYFQKGTRKNTSLVKSVLIRGNEYEIMGYNKSDELKTSGKTYIQKSNGIKTTIYRLEIRLVNHKVIKNLLQILNMDEYAFFNQLPQKDILAKIFQKAIDRVIRISGGTSILNFIVPQKTQKRGDSLFYAPYLLIGGGIKTYVCDQTGSLIHRNPISICQNVSQNNTNPVKNRCLADCILDGRMMCGANTITC